MLQVTSSYVVCKAMLIFTYLVKGGYFLWCLFFHPSICLSVCKQHYSKHCQQIAVKFMEWSRVAAMKN